MSSTAGAASSSEPNCDPGPRVQYRVVVAKGDERVAGPDDADVVVTVPIAEAARPDFDATVAYMQGRLKSAGPTGPLLAVLRDGSAQAVLRQLASPS